MTTLGRILLVAGALLAVVICRQWTPWRVEFQGGWEPMSMSIGNGPLVPRPPVPRAIANDPWMSDPPHVALDGALFTFRMVCAAFIAGTGLFLVVLERGTERDRRAAHGLCGQCGYDLRAGHDRCPECGAPVGPGAQGGDRSSPL